MKKIKIPLPKLTHTRLKITFIFASTVLLLSSCNQPQNKTADNPQQKKLQTGLAGNITDNLRCSADTALSYALYVPDQKIPHDGYPLILFFDAHARGKLPLKKYKRLADKYGYILAGSNNSANGQTVVRRDEIIEKMLNEMEKEYPVNLHRIYTAGFSGGARVAVRAALDRNEINGVAGCAAGFPSLKAPPRSGFSYIGFVGTSDFNYLEMKDLDQALDGINLMHYISYYTGKHDWPPGIVFEEAFVNFQLDAMRRKILDRDQSFIDTEFKKTEDSIGVYSQRKDWSGFESWLKRSVFFFEGLAPVDMYSAMLNKLTSNAGYNKHRQLTDELDKTEKNRQQALVRAMENRDLNWWNAELDELISEANSKPEDEYSTMNARLVNYLSLVSYLYADKALKQNNTTLAGKYLIIYEKVDPENPEVYFLKAKLMAKTGKKNQIVEELEKAASHGFNEPERMMNNPDFSPVDTTADFIELLDRVKQNRYSEN